MTSTIDKPKTGGKESVTYFGNRLFMITGSLWKGSYTLWKNLQMC